MKRKSGMPRTTARDLIPVEPRVYKRLAPGTLDKGVPVSVGLTDSAASERPRSERPNPKGL